MPNQLNTITNGITNTYIPSTQTGASATSNPNDSLNYGLGSAGSGALGLYQAIRGFNGLNKMGERPIYQDDQTFRNSVVDAEQRKNQGLSAGERGTALQDLNNQIRTTQQGITSASGGNLSQAVAGQLNAQKIGATNQLVNQDQAIKRNNYQNYLERSKASQEQKNLVQSDLIKNYDETSKAYGAGISNGLGQLGTFANYALLFA